MAIVQARYFVDARTNQIPGCKVDDNTKIRAEIIIQSEYGSTHEEIDMLELTIVPAGQNTCVKKFSWTGAAALKAGVTYTIDTPIFGPLAAGSYNMLVGQSGKPLSRSLAEAGINMSEVPCSGTQASPTSPTSPSGTPTSPTPTSPSGTPTQATITYRNYSITWNMVTGFYYVTSPSGISLGGYDKLSDAQARIDRAIAAGG